jgi:hypothetical protein
LLQQSGQALDEGMKDETDRTRLKALLDEMAAAKDRKTFGTSYQAFIASSGNHMTIIAPFLGALGNVFLSLLP